MPKLHDNEIPSANGSLLLTQPLFPVPRQAADQNTSGVNPYGFKHSGTSSSSSTLHMLIFVFSFFAA